MEELETLKDIVKKRQLNYACEHNHRIAKLELYLKEEAIKWIKELKFRESYQEHKERSGKTDLIHSIDWLKHFFNITENMKAIKSTCRKCKGTGAIGAHPAIALVEKGNKHRCNNCNGKGFEWNTKGVGDK